ncbi:Hypothetical predicted protein [Paramuricea clavata]|uniref:Uncharacterized protein n=1 Tax=Paramuricea clavata TaxID=317549 RepID=A0A6S7JCW2_PARCT|nr:Hypothetical predicted protein [Paramuricea clavata]
MMKKLLRNFKVKSWWSKTRWRTSSSPIKKTKRNCFNGVQSQQYVICVTLESIKQDKPCMAIESEQQKMSDMKLTTGQN